MDFVPLTSLEVKLWRVVLVEKGPVGGGPEGGGSATADPQLPLLGLNEAADPFGDRGPHVEGMGFGGVEGGVEVVDLLLLAGHWPVIHDRQALLGVLNEDQRVSLGHALIPNGYESYFLKVQVPAGNEFVTRKGQAATVD